jgi:hypothetical protein
LAWAKEFKIQPEKLVIEITEDEFNEDSESCLDVIYWTCSITRLVIEQVSQKTRISLKNSRFSGSMFPALSKYKRPASLFLQQI